MRTSSTEQASEDSGIQDDDKDRENDEARDENEEQADASRGRIDASAGRDAGATQADAGATREDASTARDAASSQGKTLPAEVLDLKLWKLTVPLETPHAGKPDEYLNPELQTLSMPPYFTVTEAGDGVVFQANADGATTGGSSYPRSELREMKGDGSEEADWSMSEGRHTLRVREAITHLPTVKPHVVAAQIHDAEDDVVMVRLEGSNLFVESGGESVGVLEANYELGTEFLIEMVAAEGAIDVSYNGTKKVHVASTAAGCYFKAGCYTQSNLSKGDKADAYGQVIVTELVVTHEP